jgi:hypothetical protein
MNVRDYIDVDEEILAEVKIHDDPYALFFSGADGTLACTVRRAVYVSGKEVKDVSLNRVDSFGRITRDCEFLLSYWALFSLQRLTGCVQAL